MCIIGPLNSADEIFAPYSYNHPLYAEIDEVASKIINTGSPPTSRKKAWALSGRLKRAVSTRRDCSHVFQYLIWSVYAYTQGGPSIVSLI